MYFKILTKICKIADKIKNEAKKATVMVAFLLRFFRI